MCALQGKYCLSCFRCVIQPSEIVRIARGCDFCYKKARAACFDNDLFNPLTFTEDTEKEINAKDICGVVTEAFLNNWRIEMTAQEFVVYQSTMIDYVDSVTIDEARKCLGEDDMAIYRLFQKINTIKEKKPFERVHVLR